MKMSARRLLILVAGLILVGCSTHKWTDVSGEPGYKEMIGKEFKIKREGIIYKFSRKDDYINLDFAGRNNLPELKDIPRVLPGEYDGQHILGVVPSGSTFKVVKAMRVHSFESEYVVYKALINGDGPFKGTEVDPTWLTDQEAIPKFKQEYVEAIEGGR